MRVLTWNIRWGLGADGRVDLARIADWIADCDPDLLALQEVCRNFPAQTYDDPADQPAWLGERFPGYSVQFCPAIDIFISGQRRQFGNLVMSRYPLRQVMAHRLPRPPAVSTGISFDRSAIEVLLSETPVGTLRFICTHLEYAAPLQRLAQASYLRQRLEEIAAERTLPPQAVNLSDTPLHTLPSCDAVLLCGDFNAGPTDAAIELLLAPASPLPMRDLWRESFPDQLHPPTLGLRSAGHDPQNPVCFDFIMGCETSCRALVTVGTDAQIAASDHQPFWADFRQIAI